MIASRIKLGIFALVGALLVLGPAWLSYTTARGDDIVPSARIERRAVAPHPYRDAWIAQADTVSSNGTTTLGSALPDGSAAAPAPASSPAAPAPQASDVGVMTKLYKNGSFFALGIMVLFIGLSIWSRLDKKHAFYIATALGGIALVVESIRRGDTPNATSLMTMLMTTGGIMIAGPGHAKATPS